MPRTDQRFRSAIGSDSCPVAAPSAAPDSWRTYAQVLAVLDLTAMAAGALLAQGARFGSLGVNRVPSTSLSYLRVAVILAAAWVCTMAVAGAYERRYLAAGTEEYRRILVGATRFLAFVGVVSFVAKFDVARGYVAIAIPVATGLTLMGRLLARRVVHSRYGKARFLKTIVVVGTGASVDRLSRRLAEAPFAGYVLHGVCVPVGSEPLDLGSATSITTFADTRDVLRTVRELGADAVAVADAVTFSPADLRALDLGLEGSDIELLMAPSIVDVAGPRILVRPVSDLPLLHIEVPELAGARRLVKEVTDRTMAACLLVASIPILVLAALAVLVLDGRPILFKQVRVGRNGDRFVLWKVRTMTVGAEARLAALMGRNEQDGPLFKIRADPRITTIGRRLRRWSLDELPQLWNVVRGDMSLVGPRPPLPSEVERFSARDSRRLLVKPGITGIWQVNGRSTLSWDESLRLDLYYVEHWSLSLDAAIMFKTIAAVIRARGAY